MFSCEFYQIFQSAFFVKHIWVTAFAKYPVFVRYVYLSHKKCFLQPWLFWIFSRQTLRITCEQSFMGALDSQLWLSWFIRKSEAVSHLSSVKMRFCKTSQIQ